MEVYFVEPTIGYHKFEVEYCFDHNDRLGRYKIKLSDECYNTVVDKMSHLLLFTPYNEWDIWAKLIHYFIMDDELIYNIEYLKKENIAFSQEEAIKLIKEKNIEQIIL